MSGKTMSSVCLVLFLLCLMSGCSNQPVSVDGGQDVQPAVVQNNEKPSEEKTEPIVTVEGNLGNPYEFKYSDFAGQEITITAQFIGCSKTKPPREYLGIPVPVIISRADPNEDSVKLTVIGSDDYKKTYVLEDVMKDEQIILTNEEGLQIITGDKEKYDAAYWVRDVEKMIIE